MHLDIFEVQSCCYFISLRTGAKIFGFISLLGCALASTFSVWELAVVARVDKVLDIELILDLIAQTVQMLTSVFLLMGAYQEKPKFIIPWMISTLVSAILEVIFMPSFVGRFIGIHMRNFTEWLVFTIFLLVDDIYGLVVVFSYYRSLLPQHQDVM